MRADRGNDALGSLLASAVARRVPPGTAPPGLLQRANDKFAITFEPSTSTPTPADVLKQELQHIYREQRRVKKEARAQLDVAHQRGVDNLEKRQEALAERALPIVSERFNTELLDAAKLKLKAPAAGAEALRLAGEEDARKVAAAVYDALSARAQDAVAAKGELPEEARKLGESIDAELDRVAKLENGEEIASRARVVITASVQTFGATVTKRTLPKDSPAAAFNVKLGKVIGQAGKKDFKADEAVATFEPGERAYVSDKLANLRSKALATPHPYAGLDVAADSVAKDVLAAIAGGIRLAQAVQARIEQIAGDVRTTTTEHARHYLADPLVAAYEKGFLATGMDLAKLKRAWSEAAEKQGCAVSFRKAARGHEIVLSGGGSDRETIVGKLFENDERFVPVTIATATVPAHVHYHAESSQEYVQDASNLFVRRFVARCLNEYDNPKDDEIKISVDPRTKKDTAATWGDIALGLPSQPEPERDKEIWAHQRKKELQGGSPFVSFTTSKHAIFGSTAKYFEGKWGVATVDLAQVPKERIVDTHQQRAYKRITGLDVPDPDMPFRENDDAVEKNTAARDAMRTRELVVIGSLPLEAVVKLDRYEWDAGTGTFVPKQAYTRAQLADKVKFTPV